MTFRLTGYRGIFVVAALLPILLASVRAQAAPRFTDHGVAVKASCSLGVAAAVDRDNRPVILAQISDINGWAGVTMIDAETGKARLIKAPVGGHGYYGILHSSRNRQYFLLNGVFMEFDVLKERFTFSGKTQSQTAMSFTEGPDGKVWCATYPDTHVVSYDPETRTLKDHGSINKESWRQYPRDIACDDAGWVYVRVGKAKMFILALNPATGRATCPTGKLARASASGTLFRSTDGKVYGKATVNSEWLLLSGGKGTPAGQVGGVFKGATPAAIRGAPQKVNFPDFPDGEKIAEINVPEKWITIRPNDGAVRKVAFDYSSEGCFIKSMTVGPDGLVVGCTGFPMFIWGFDRRSAEFTTHALYPQGHWNQMLRCGDSVFGAQYSGGRLYRWRPGNPWSAGAKREANPAYLGSFKSVINRPNGLALSPGEDVLVMTGAPGYGVTGGGLAIHDVAKGTSETLTHEQLILNQSILCGAFSEDGGYFIGGSSIHAGTGGEIKSKVACVFLLDMKTRKVVWKTPVIPKGISHADMIRGADGLIYGLCETEMFGPSPTLFVLDPARREIVFRKALPESWGGVPYAGDGQKAFVAGKDGALWLVLQRAICRMTPGRPDSLEKVATPPERISIAGAVVDGRLYFGIKANLWSMATD